MLPKSYQGEGEFVTGPPVYPPMYRQTHPYEMGRRRKALISKANKVLPSEYQRVEYLESTGTQWIKADYYPSNLTRVTTTACILQFKNYSFFFGSRNGAGNNEFEVANVLNGNKGYQMRSDFFKTDDRRFAEYIPNLGEFFEIDKNKNSCLFGGVAIVNPNHIFDVPYKLTIFGVSHAGTVNNAETLIGRIKNFKIWTDGVLNKSLIPCYRISDNKPGMYDTVSKQFLTNQGTGEFVLGPEV